MLPCKLNIRAAPTSPMVLGGLFWTLSSAMPDGKQPLSLEDTEKGVEYSLCNLLFACCMGLNITSPKDHEDPYVDRTWDFVDVLKWV